MDLPWDDLDELETYRVHGACGGVVIRRAWFWGWGLPTREYPKRVRVKRYSGLPEHLRVLHVMRTDLARRCRAAGIGIAFAGDAGVIHAARGAGDLPQDLRGTLDAFDHAALVLAAHFMPRIERIAVMYERRYSLAAGDLFSAAMDGFVAACGFTADPVDFVRRSSVCMHAAVNRAAFQILRARAVNAPMPECSSEDDEGSADAQMNEVLKELHDFLPHLPERCQFVIRRHLGLDPDGECDTYIQIGEALGISRERVRQLRNESLRGFQDHLRQRLAAGRTHLGIEAG